MKSTREKGRRGTGGGAEGRKGGGGGRRGQLLRRRFPGAVGGGAGPGEGKGRVGREGSGGDARCAAALPVPLRVERVAARPHLSRAGLSGLCLKGR